MVIKYFHTLGTIMDASGCIISFNAYEDKFRKNKFQDLGDIYILQLQANYFSVFVSLSKHP